MASATQQALTRAPTVLSPPTAAVRAYSYEQWVMSLPATVRTQLTDRLTKIVQGLPLTLQHAYLKAMAASGHPNPIPVAAAGLGGIRTIGLGQWGAVIGALVSASAQAGTSLYEAKQSNDLQKQLQSNSLATSAQVAQAQTDAQKQTQLAMIAAQEQAAKIAGQALVGQAAVNAAAKITTSRTNAPIIQHSLMWVGIGAAVLAAIGGGIFVWRKSHH